MRFPHCVAILPVKLFFHRPLKFSCSGNSLVKIIDQEIVFPLDFFFKAALQIMHCIFLRLFQSIAVTLNNNCFTAFKALTCEMSRKECEFKASKL